MSHSSDWAGAEQSMVSLFEHWRRKQGVEVEFIIRKPLLRLAAELTKRRFTYHTLYYTNWVQRSPTADPLEIHWYAKQNTRAVREIEKLIARFKPDLVMTNTIVAPWAAIAARRAGISHVWFIREFGEADHGFAFRLGRDQTFTAIGQLSDLVVANSATLETFAAKFIPKQKLSVLYPLLDLNAVQAATKSSGLSPFKVPASLKLVVTGRIAESKGQAVAAAAVGLLHARGVAAELCVVGSPSNPGDDAALNAAIAQYQIADLVHLVGHQAEPLPYVAHADVGVTASTQEAFGRVTLEYMAMGKPVVGADSGATPELIEAGRNGFLFAPNDPAVLADALMKYAGNAELRAAHGQASLARAKFLLNQKYTPEIIYSRLQTLVGTKPAGNNEALWNKYPVLMTAEAKAPAVGWSADTLKTRAKLLLKSLYVRFR